MESIPKQNIERLTEIAAKAADTLGLKILRLTSRGTPSRAILEVILDGDRLVRVDDCQTVSKALGDAIEADESLLKGNFRLDVLSPGLDEPLVLDYQFQRTIGHLVEISYTEGDTKQSVTGNLNSFTSEMVNITKRQNKRGGKSVKGEDVEIPRASILTAFARPDFG